MALTIVADGDSWLDYPKILMTGGGLADHLAGIMGADLINVAKAGNSSEETTGLKNTNRLRAALPKADVFLISSGGDDLVGARFRLAIAQNKGQSTQGGINWDWVDDAFNLIIEDYRNLTALRDELCPAACILTHSYGFPPPAMMGKGVLWLGPWLQPGFIDRGGNNPDEQAYMTLRILKEFERRLSAFAATNRNHVHSNLQNILQPEDFGNELHLKWAGWNRGAQTINANYLAWQMKNGQAN